MKKNKLSDYEKMKEENEKLVSENIVLNEKLSDSEHEADLEHSRYVRLNLEFDKVIKENQILKKSFEFLEEENKRLKEIIHNGKF